LARPEHPVHKCKMVQKARWRGQFLAMHTEARVLTLSERKRHFL
jgi:hypothetical protein